MPNVARSNQTNSDNQSNNEKRSNSNTQMKTQQPAQTQSPPAQHNPGTIRGFANQPHVTKDEMPDRRFVENRDLTPEEAEIEGAKNILRKAGITKID